MNFPQLIRAGDTVKWREIATSGPLGESITSDDWTLTFSLRAAGPASGAANIVGSAYSVGWEFSILKTVTADFESGDWFWQAVATKGAESFTVGSGGFTVLESLLSSNPGSFDPRTKTEILRDKVQTAIEKIISGAQEYTIGGRTFKRAELKDLRVYHSQLTAQVNRAKKAQKIRNGLGDPTTLNVRF